MSLCSCLPAFFPATADPADIGFGLQGDSREKTTRLLVLGALPVALGLLAGCAATESSRAQVASAGRIYSGMRTPIAVGKIDNRSSYMRGIFSDGVDRLGGQAKTILITHLQQTNHFNVLDR